MTTEHTLESFYNQACEEFGKDFFSIKGIEISEDNLRNFNLEHKSNLTKEDFSNYKAVWIINKKCPRCDSELGGIFGSFEWGLVHGSGRCGNCRRVDIKYYHYIKDCKYPIQAFSLIGF